MSKMAAVEGRPELDLSVAAACFADQERSEIHSERGRE